MPVMNQGFLSSGVRLHQPPRSLLLLPGRFSLSRLPLVKWQGSGVSETLFGSGSPFVVGSGFRA
jgi:hypothetical protein